MTEGQMEQLLTEAEDGASTPWEEDFVRDQRERLDMYGERTRFSKLQLEILRWIAEPKL